MSLRGDSHRFRPFFPPCFPSASFHFDAFLLNLSHCVSPSATIGRRPKRFAVGRAQLPVRRLLSSDATI